MLAVVLSLLLPLGLTLQPPELPSEPAPAKLPEERVEFPLDSGRAPTPEPLERMEPAPGPASERRSIVDLRDPFDRPPLRPRTGHVLAQQRLMMPDLKDPFAEGIRRVRSRTLEHRVPSDLRNPFRDGAGRKGAPACVRTTNDGVVVQKPGAKSPPIDAECRPNPDDLHDPFRDGKSGKSSPAPARPPKPPS